MQYAKNLVASKMIDIVDLPIPQSPTMDYQEAFVAQVGSRVVIGYLADDDIAENPLEAMDGEGSVYSAHRHSTTHDEMQKALALDQCWSPDLELVYESPKDFRREWIKQASDDAMFQDWCLENGRPPHEESDLPSYFKRKAERFYRQAQKPREQEAITDFDLTENVEEAVWKSLFESGKIGEPDRVMLDVYEHSGTLYSVSGEGMQCRWDTASGGAVWAPDNCAREEIDRRAPVYAFGTVESRMRFGKTTYWFELDDRFGGTQSIQYTQWYEAFDALRQCIKSNKLALPRKGMERDAAIYQGRRRASVELCKGSLDLLNDWLAGNAFDAVIATYQFDGDFVLESEETLNCIYGVDGAMDEMQAMARSAVQDLMQPE